MGLRPLTPAFAATWLGRLVKAAGAALSTLLSPRLWMSSASVKSAGGISSALPRLRYTPLILTAWPPSTNTTSHEGRPP